MRHLGDPFRHTVTAGEHTDVNRNDRQHDDRPNETLGGILETYAYRRVGGGIHRPLICLQHFTGTLDNWDPAVMNSLELDRKSFCSTTQASANLPGRFRPQWQEWRRMRSISSTRCGYQLRRARILARRHGGTADGAGQAVSRSPNDSRRDRSRGGEDIMHLEKPTLARHLGDPTLKGYAVLQKLFFAPTSSSQAAGGSFIERLALRKEDLDTPSGPDVAAAQMAAFREWEQPTAVRFGDLKQIHQPTLVVNGVHDAMIPVSNSYRLSENLPNAMLLTYPDAGHGSLFQFCRRLHGRPRRSSRRTRRSHRTERQDVV